jgi:hypothetical protein
MHFEKLGLGCFSLWGLRCLLIEEKKGRIRKIFFHLPRTKRDSIKKIEALKVLRLRLK